MALITMNYNSPTIGMHQNLTIILPEDITFFDSSRTAQLAIIMPNVDHSGYANMVYGHSYYDYILEIYEYVHQILPLSRKREDNFIAGHSMGGYGTIKFALTQSNKFAKAAPLSAVFEAQRLIDLDWIDFSPQAITGRDTQIKGTELDTYYLLDQAIDANVDIPELFIMCG
ncbi:MAG: alpha/beta hydrolase-fold protein, partial [Staphylococcus epidermidis]|nr:alpha/beta hydrolase-fold protein [Staphylococcus epidermidis]MDU1499351.1 alpha/beta hydrolase-fold protein [Staphylococcus epidermidis]